MKSIAMIMPYFGSLPAQYAAWRYTAERNATVDFHLFTDAEVAEGTNIIVHRMTFEEFAELFRKAFEFEIVLDRPYKLCEYKPAYGYVLQRFIADYDYWGFGDMDLVYGDIRAFLTDEILERYKFFLGYGHMTLFRNDADTNAYFMTQADSYQYYRDAFTTERITFFDEFEHGGMADRWRDLRPDDCALAAAFGGEQPFDNASKPKQEYHFVSLTRGWKQVIFEHVGAKLYMLRIRGGKVERKESLYAHFQHRNFMRCKVKDWGHFIVLPATITDYPRHLTMMRLRHYCRNRHLITLYYRWRDRIAWKLRTLRH